MLAGVLGLEPFSSLPHKAIFNTFILPQRRNSSASKNDKSDTGLNVKVTYNCNYFYLTKVILD